MLVSPTPNREETKTAIDQIKLSERTATGEGIFTALQSIETLGAVLGGAEEPPPARIVLLSDGKQTVPESPDDPRGGYTAAREAKNQGVPISTISFGTSYGTVDIRTSTAGPSGCRCRSTTRRCARSRNCPAAVLHRVESSRN